MSGDGRRLQVKARRHRSDRRRPRKRLGTLRSASDCKGRLPIPLRPCGNHLWGDAVKGPSTARLIAVPALISIAVTALRLVGELLRWPKPMVSSDVCGKAILGVVWLVPIFGIYFAVRLFHAGDAPQRFARPLVFAASALALKLAGTFVMESHGMTYAARLSMNFIVTLIGRGLADTVQGAAGLWIPGPNSSGHRPVLGYAWPLGHALRCLGSRISCHRLLANLSPRFLRPEHLFHGGLYGHCRWARRDPRCRDTTAAQKDSVGGPSLGTSTVRTRQ